MDFDNILPFGSVPVSVEIYEPPQLLVQNPIDFFMPLVPHSETPKNNHCYLRCVPHL